MGSKKFFCLSVCVLIDGNKLLQVSELNAEVCLRGHFVEGGVFKRTAAPPCGQAVNSFLPRF